MTMRQIGAVVLAGSIAAAATGDDDGGVPQPPANTIYATCTTSGNPPAKGVVRLYGKFDGFQQPVITSHKMTLYTVKVDAQGNRTETKVGELNHIYAQPVKSGERDTAVGQNVKSGDVVCARFEISTGINPVPLNSQLTYVTPDFTIP